MGFVDNYTRVRRKESAADRGSISKDEGMVYDYEVRISGAMARLINEAARIERTAFGAAFLGGARKLGARQGIE